MINLLSRPLVWLFVVLGVTALGFSATQVIKGWGAAAEQARVARANADATQRAAQAGAETQAALIEQALTDINALNVMREELARLRNVAAGTGEDAIVFGADDGNWLRGSVKSGAGH